MKHEKAKKLLSQYVSGLLPGERRAEIETHINNCGECRDEINTLNSMITVLKKGPSERLSSREFETIKLRVQTGVTGVTGASGMQRSEKAALPEKGDLRIFSPVFVISFLLFVFSTIFFGKQLVSELTTRQMLLVATFIYLQVTGTIAFYLLLKANKDNLRWPFRLFRDSEAKVQVKKKNIPNK